MHYVDQFADVVKVIRGSSFQIDEVNNYDKIIFSPGPGLPKEHPILQSTLQKFHFCKPILGICLGHQAIAEYFGAKLVNLSEVKHGVTSVLNHSDNCILFQNIKQKFKIGHYHSWVISKKDFPDELVVTSENSEGLIMSIQHKEYDITAVQFHPESILTENGLKLIENWVRN
jgi:anthranilate synthase component 2